MCDDHDVVQSYEILYLPPEASGPTDAMQVVFDVGGEIVVDYEGHLLDVDTWFTFGGEF